MICMHLYLRASKAAGASDIDGVSGYYSGSVIISSGFARLRSDERCHDASKEKVASGLVLFAIGSPKLSFRVSWVSFDGLITTVALLRRTLSVNRVPIWPAVISVDPGSRIPQLRSVGGVIYL